MARRQLSAATFIQCAILLVLVWSKGTAAISLEGKLQQLEEKLESKLALVEAENVQLIGKVTQLELQLQQQNEIKETLASKVDQLESLLTALQKNNQQQRAVSEWEEDDQSAVVASDGMPTSCRDLRILGHLWSGIYSVMGNHSVETVYCDFTKVLDDPGFEKWIGYTDVKSARTYFYVQRETDFKVLNTPIPFEIERLNVGRALDLASGIFTAPRTGTYFFSFTGMGHFITSSATRVYVYVGLFLNGDKIGSGLVDEANTVSYQNSPLMIQSTLNLKEGDQVWTAITTVTAGMYLHDSTNHYTHFSGWMLDEDIYQSL